MKICGLDFTSAPNPKKPITCIICELIDNSLNVTDFTKLVSFTQFETFLNQPGPWIAGLDFPFGQPHRLIQNLGWPASWVGYVQKIASMNQAEFEVTLAKYRQSRPSGDKQHLRATDVLAKSRSPMMLYGVPVGKMFFQGAPRLWQAGVSIRPCYPTSDARIVIEAYPALVARKLITGSYKNDIKKKQTTAQETARINLIQGLRSNKLRDIYDFTVTFSDSMADKLIHDPTGDSLDALLCAIQAAWAYQRREQDYGIPDGCDPIEGWIVDPDLMTL